jgi:hypothetical protein
MIFGICQIKSKSALLLHDAHLIYFFKKTLEQATFLPEHDKIVRASLSHFLQVAAKKAQSKPFIQPPSALKG